MQSIYNLTPYERYFWWVQMYRKVHCLWHRKIHLVTFVFLVLSNGSVTYQLIHLYKKFVVSVVLIAFWLSASYPHIILFNELLHHSVISFTFRNLGLGMWFHSLVRLSHEVPSPFSHYVPPTINKTQNPLKACDNRGFLLIVISC